MTSTVCTQRLARTRFPDEAAGILAEIDHLRLQSGSDAADLLLARALKARASDRLPLALQLFDAVVDLYPDWPEAWSERATTRYLTGDSAGAMADLAQTLKRDPRDIGALAGLGAMMLELRRPRRGAQGLRPRPQARPRLRAAEGGARPRANDGLEPLALIEARARRSWRAGSAVLRLHPVAAPPCRAPLSRRSAIASTSAPAGCMSSRRRREGPERGAVAARPRRLRQFRRSSCRARRASGGQRASASSPSTVPGHGWSDRLAGRAAASPRRQAAYHPSGAGDARRRAGDRRRPFARRASWAWRWRWRRRNSRAASCCSPRSAIPGRAASPGTTRRRRGRSLGALVSLARRPARRARRDAAARCARSSRRTPSRPTISRRTRLAAGAAALAFPRQRRGFRRALRRGARRWRRAIARSRRRRRS